MPPKVKHTINSFTAAVLLITVMPWAAQQAHANDLYTSNRCLVKKANNLEKAQPIGLVLVWTGECLNGLTNGQGRLTAKKGDHTIFSYEGNMANGLFSGQGSIQWPAIKSSYKGSWQSGEITGVGVFHYDDGAIYEGAMKNGEPEGQGRMVWAKESYQGEWKGGFINGKGIYHFADGRIYEGYMKNGLPDGEGAMTWPDTRDSYKGEWKNDKMHGKGIYRYGDGTVYEGSFNNDSFSGKGKLTWTNGDYFIGPFKNDLANGKGTLHKADGTFKETTYVNGKIAQPTITKRKESPISEKVGREDYPCEPFIQVSRGGRLEEIYYTPFGPRAQASLEVFGVSSDADARKQVERWRTVEPWPDANRNDIIKGRIQLLSGLKDTLDTIMRGGPDENWYQQYIYMLTCYQEAGWPEDVKYRRCSLNPPGKLGGMNGACVPM